MSSLRTTAFFVLASTVFSLTYGWFLRDYALHQAPDAGRVALKMLPVATLALLSTLRGPRLLTAALTLGAVGDALLAINGAAPYVGGAIAFFAGHICYIMLFLGAGTGFGATFKQPARAIAMVALVISALACAFWLWPRDGTIIPIAIYTIALTGMAMSTFTLSRRAWLAMLGGVLFFISDVLLTWNADKPPQDAALAAFLNDASWFTYWLGQLGLCLGGLRLGKVTGTVI